MNNVRIGKEISDKVSELHSYCRFLNVIQGDVNEGYVVTPEATAEGVTAFT